MSRLWLIKRLLDSTLPIPLTSSITLLRVMHICSTTTEACLHTTVVEHIHSYVYIDSVLKHDDGETRSRTMYYALSAHSYFVWALSIPLSKFWTKCRQALANVECFVHILLIPFSQYQKNEEEKGRTKVRNLILVSASKWEKCHKLICRIDHPVSNG